MLVNPLVLIYCISLANPFSIVKMRFTAAAFVFGLVAISVATPTPSMLATKTKAKRALTSQSYADFQVSDGVAGNALAEVQANFPVCIFQLGRFITDPC